MTGSKFEKHTDNQSGDRPAGDGLHRPGDGGSSGEKNRPAMGRPFERRRPSEGDPVGKGDGSNDWDDADTGHARNGGPGGPDSGRANDERASGVPALRSRQQPVPARSYSPDMYSPPSAYNEPPIEEAGIDLRKYLWLLFKHRWLIGGSAVVFVILGLLATLLTTPVYRASATIQINRSVDKVVDFEGPDVQAGRDFEFYQTQYDLLKSRTLAERVAADLNLQDDGDFLSADIASPLTKLKRLLFGEHQGNSTGTVTERQKAAGGAVRAGLNVQPTHGSSIVGLSYDSPNPHLAQKIVNAVADAFIKASLERRYDASTYARTFLEERLQQLKIKLAESEKSYVGNWVMTV